MPGAPYRFPSTLLAALFVSLGSATLAAPPAGAASISGVCPDGSIFIVQDRNRIPCNAAKEVSPNEMPPLRPEYLPRSYSWQVYRETANPNNPYNLIDAARKIRALNGGPPTEFGAGAPPSGANGAGAPPPGFAALRAEPAAPTLALAPDEIRDLFLIIELSQRAAPARFVKEDAQGEAALEVSFAWSEAFETRMRSAAPELDGPVILFSVVAHQPERFDPNLTFVQGHETFRPLRDDPRQLGWLEGQAGEVPAEGVALGYVVLPDRMDPGRDLDLYWNDRRIGIVLRP